MHKKPIIGITTGDINGVGPEVIIKTFADARMMDGCTPVIFASAKLLDFYNKQMEEGVFKYHVIRDFEALKPGVVNLFTCWDEEVSIQPGALTDTGGKYAVRSLMVAAQCLKDGQLDAVVTAPIHKSNTHLTDFPFTGHTPFFKEKFGAKDVLMLLYTETLRMGLATEHIPLSEVAGAITKELLQSKITLMRECLIKDFGIDKPKIAVLGLNPHAGDEGKIGTEEQTIIRPLLDALQKQGHLAFGPYSADAFFARRSYLEFDGVLAMYHDQGLIPFKTLSGGEGVNYTAGLPVIRTSPDHGTAFDIAGNGMVDPSSFREAVFQAISLVEQRAHYAAGTANPLRRSSGQRERGNDRGR